MRKSLLLLAVVVQLAIAQTSSPPDFMRGVPMPKAGEIITTPFAALPKETQRILTQDQHVTADGVRVLQSTEAHVHLLDKALSLAVSKGPDNMPMDRVTAFARWQFLGYVLDGPETHRVNRLWRDNQGRLVMLTEWDYKATGGGVHRFAEFLTERVRGEPAALALSRAPQSSSALWKLGWTTGEKDYELYVAEPQLADADINVHRQIVLSYANAIGE